jgi:hypothetical protein
MEVLAELRRRTKSCRALLRPTMPQRSLRVGMSRYNYSWRYQVVYGHGIRQEDGRAQ